MVSSVGAPSLVDVVSRLYNEYNTKTPQKLKIIDAYLGYIMITGVIQFVYCCLVGTFPFNSFLSGFISTVASFVLGVCLRIQSNPQNTAVFKDITVERAFADFIFAHCVLHLVVLNFIGMTSDIVMEESEVPRKRLKFRSYKPLDQNLQGKQMAPAVPMSIEDTVKDIVSESTKTNTEIDLNTIAPRKANWDLKRDAEKKLHKLETRTKRAMAEIIREKLRAEKELPSGDLPEDGVDSD